MTAFLKMSQAEEGLVEFVSNIGPVITKDNVVKIAVFPRSTAKYFNQKMLIYLFD